MGTVITSSMDAPSPQDFGEIGKLVGGYRISQAIYVVVEIGIPDLLAAGPKDCDELATESNTHALTLYRILRFLAGLGLGGNESYPGIFQPFGGFADGIPVEDSYVKLPDVPGIGFETKNELYRVMKTLTT